MIDRETLEREAVPLLQALIRFNTVNPPGHEAQAQDFIRHRLIDAGFHVELYALDAVRPNLIATLPGKSDGPTVALLSHVDTVLADPAEWTHDPWSGELKDGCVWGRGAQDMKGQTAAEIAAAICLAKSGWRPESGTLKVIVTSDEEAGGNFGARWLCENHPNEARADIILNEGGGQTFIYEGRRYYRVGCAEKGFSRFNIVAHGKAGHASVPRMGENALLKLAVPLERLANGQPEYDLTDEPRAILAALFGREPSIEDVPAMLDEIEQKDPRLAVLLEPTLGVTLTPTMASASQKVNVIPAHASVRVDCRVPPGFGADHAERRAREVLGEGDFDLEFGESAIGNRSPHDTPLMEEIKRWVAEIDPNAIAVPSVLPGFTDSRWFRDAFPECVAYGFFPQLAMDMYESEPLIHGADERIPVEDLVLASAFFADVVPKLLS
ncbi:MAG TPA: M20/M25/M40 family metallo-hydrolase [Solirubrobacterales bacterium]|jgi:acetylornithine deacetylase/succinyl-diaminopimelate desuccinylase-like protein|nr:M20/M25/M40 family metallo-hydrolase [Solirubrobacterales bacterium]